MAEDQTEREHAQAETVLSSPASPQTAHGATKAVKDRSCPFCGHAFTSSSLGRHLDLYIRPKNPKPRDGVHDVDEIRKIRGGITRRQPRTSQKAAANAENGEEGGNDGTARGGEPTTATTTPQGRSGDDSAAAAPNERPSLDTPQPGINKANWFTTGVINNLPAAPPRATSRINGASTTPAGQAQRMSEMRQDLARPALQRPDYDAEGLWKLQEDAEVGRAAELALREVLSSLEAAKQKFEKRELFDGVDFMGLSFPGLCLAVLPPPPALFSRTPFPGADSWSLTPPGKQQFEALNVRVVRQLHAKRGGNALTDDPRFPDRDTFMHSAHVQGAYEHWCGMSEAERASAWTVELMRAFARAAEQTTALRHELATAHHRIRHLEAEFDRLCRCQLPREYLLHPPHTTPASPVVMQELADAKLHSGADAVGFNADALLNKWRAAVRATTRKSASAATQSAASASAASSSRIYSEPTRSVLRSDMLINGALLAVNGAFPRDDEGLIRNPTALRPLELEPQTPNAHTGPSAEGETPMAVSGDGAFAEEEEVEGDAATGLRTARYGSRPERLKSPAGAARGRAAEGGSRGGLNGNGKRPLAARENEPVS